jgi:hypothetical protein
MNYLISVKMALSQSRRTITRAAVVLLKKLLKNGNAPNNAKFEEKLRRTTIADPAYANFVADSIGG